jgi:hypothetical protein
MNQLRVILKWLYSVLILNIYFLVEGCTSSTRYNEIREIKQEKTWKNTEQSVVYKLGSLGSSNEVENITVTLNLNGEGCTFVIDTGAASSWFSEAYVSSHKLDVLKSGYHAKGLGGANAHFKLIRFRNAEFDFAKVSDWLVISGKIPSIDDDANLPTKLGYPKIVGILGSDILSYYRAVLDYSKMEITFQSPIGSKN